ncbi:hypothetical protein EON63_06940 [archaeon]|nr:MAG: hypothetical protein EON63_06940 [archaeon]
MLGLIHICTHTGYIYPPKHSPITHIINSPFPSFRAGKYCTKFIPEEYPKGFDRVQLSADETKQFIASTVAIHLARNPHLLKVDEQVGLCIGLSCGLTKSDQTLVLSTSGYCSC